MRDAFEAGVLPPGAPEPPGWEEREVAGAEALVIRHPRADPEWLRALAARLRHGQEALLDVPVRRRVQALGRVGLRLLDEADPLAREALEWLPPTAGISVPMAREVLRGMAWDWTPERLEALVEAELPDPEVLDRFQPGRGDGKTRAMGHALTVHVGAGNVAGVTATSAIRGLLVGSAVLAKPGAGDVVLPALVARGLREEAPELAGALAVVYWPGGTPSAEEAVLGEADLVVVYGGPEAVEDLRGRTPPTTPFVAYHHRVSLGVVGREGLTSKEAPLTARRAARATALFDQRGCVSPHVLYAEEGGEVAPRAWAGLVAEALAGVEEELPTGPLLPGEASAVHQARGAAELRAAAGEDVDVHAGADAPWTVIYDPDPAFEPSCLSRVVRVKPVADLAEVPALLASLAPFVQTVAVEGAGERREELAEALARAGVVRITSLEAAPWPPPWWHHDGAGPLRVLLRWTDLEG